MTKSIKSFKYAATLVGALAVLAIAPATAFATDNDDSGPGGCNYTDADGYNIPIHNGEDVFVDGKIVSCRNGSVVVTTGPRAGFGRARPAGRRQPAGADRSRTFGALQAGDSEASAVRQGADPDRHALTPPYVRPAICTVAGRTHVAGLTQRIHR